MKKEQYPARKGLNIIFECVPKVAVCTLVGKSKAWLSQRMARYLNANGNTYYFSKSDIELLNAAIQQLHDNITTLTLPLNQKADPVAFREAVEHAIGYVKASWLYEGLSMRRMDWHNRLSEKDARYWFTNHEIARIQDMLTEAAEILAGTELLFEELEKK